MFAKPNPLMPLEDPYKVSLIEARNSSYYVQFTVNSISAIIGVYTELIKPISLFDHSPLFVERHLKMTLGMFELPIFPVTYVLSKLGVPKSNLHYSKEVLEMFEILNSNFVV